MKDIWILVADGGHARIFTAETLHGELTEVESFTQPQIRMKGTDVRSDRPGRTFDSGGEGHHAMEYRTDHKDQARQEFARELAQRLELCFQEGKFEKLVLVAEPSFLGHMRRHISSHLQKAISHQVDKNLTHLTPDKVRELLSDQLASAPA